jgi:hypothetical protein
MDASHAPSHTDLKPHSMRLAVRALHAAPDIKILACSMCTGMLQPCQQASPCMLDGTSWEPHPLVLLEKTSS